MFQHDHGMIHRDIKAENVFFLTPSQVSSTDFLLDQQREMSLLYFGLDLFCPFDARAPESDVVYSTIP
jgi:serine/threonine protein kinase